MTLHIYGEYGQACGYTTHTLAFAEVLQHHVQVRLRRLSGRLEATEVPAALRHLVDADETVEPEVALMIGGLESMAAFPGHYRIGFVVFETTRLPAASIEVLADLDQIWVPSRWCRDRLIEQGLSPAKISWVPEGVDGGFFVASETAADSERFRFLCVGKWEERKCQEMLVRIFIDTFSRDEPVELVIHGENPFLSGFCLQTSINLASIRPDHRIVASYHKTREELLALYRCSDVFVLPTRGEAFGLPVAEAMACGLPVIATDYSGTGEMLSPSHGWPIPVKRMTKVRDRVHFPRGYEYGKWAEPDWRALSRLMRTAFDNPAEGRRLGARAAEYIRQSYSWERAGSVAARALQRVGT